MPCRPACLLPCRYDPSTVLVPPDFFKQNKVSEGQKQVGSVHSERAACTAGSVPGRAGRGRMMGPGREALLRQAWKPMQHCACASPIHPLHAPACYSIAHLHSQLLSPHTNANIPPPNPAPPHHHAPASKSPSTPTSLPHLLIPSWQWWDFKAWHYDSVLLFKMGKFYELFEMDAHVGAEVLGLSYMKASSMGGTLWISFTSSFRDGRARGGRSAGPVLHQGE